MRSRPAWENQPYQGVKNGIPTKRTPNTFATLVDSSSLHRGGALCGHGAPWGAGGLNAQFGEDRSTHRTDPQGVAWGAGVEEDQLD